MDIGTLVAGRYRLDRPIAAGGMGEVWRGFDALLERPVAVKILHPRPGDAQRLCDRFAREAKILASLRGPGLVEIYDYGEETSGRRPMRYIVMELIEGAALATMLAERGPLPLEETLRYLAEAAEALGVAHEGGVVHRDVKPGNLLVEPDGRLRVVDFGISLTENDARLTSAGGIMGTPSYVSPEQLGGREVCGTADLYSLGAVAYECITGRPPFTAEDPLEVVGMHLHQEPPPLPDDLPPAVAAIVLRCLRKDPAERWPSAVALAAACRAAAESLTATAHPTGNEPTGHRHRRRPRAVAFLAVVILVLTAIGAFSIWQPWTPARADARPEAESVVTSASTAEPAGLASGAPAASDAPSEGEAPTTGEPSNPPETTEPSPGPSETGQAPTATGAVLPDVVGMDAAEAQAYLNSLGWTDVRIVSTLLLSGARSEGCAIVSQHPKPDTAVEYDHPVKIAYWGLRDCT